MPIDTIAILTPVYNDWPSFEKLLLEIDHVFANQNSQITITVIAVDDGSTLRPCFAKPRESFSNIQRIDIIELVRNLGHQKAITIGLAYVQQHYPCPVIVMDSDGEDRPSDIPRLIQGLENNQEKIVFAERSRRSEGFMFVFFYILYRQLFRLLTGKKISFGNFSILPHSLLRRVVYLPEIWNHFAAGVIRSGLPLDTVESIRGKRYQGKSKMNFISLVMHGMSAISVYLDVVATRLILFSLFVISVTIIGFIFLLYVRFMTFLAIPGWATTVAIGLVIILFQSIFFLASLSFLVLSFRSNKAFIPAKDYTDYIFEVKMEYSK